KPGGTGTALGLYVVRSLIQKHGGRIFVESQEGQGTTFSIQFPKSDRP
ncbi:MAG: ATP-binding protein, partial [Nitrospiraceae bacterium]